MRGVGVGVAFRCEKWGTTRREWRTKRPQVLTDRIRGNGSSLPVCCRAIGLQCRKRRIEGRWGGGVKGGRVKHIGFMIIHN